MKESIIYIGNVVITLFKYLFKYYILIFLFGIFVLPQILSYKKPYISNNTVLLINLSHSTQSKKHVNLIYSIKNAAFDNRINKIHLNLSMLMNIDNHITTSLAIYEEVRDALLFFKEKSNKEIDVWSENYNLVTYYLASVADNIYMAPYGMMSLNGFYYQSQFFKGLLDNLKLKYVSYKATNNDYKSAVDKFEQTKFTKQSKEQMQIYLDQMWNTVSNDILESMKNKDNFNKSYPSVNNKIFKDIIFMRSDDAIENGLITGIIYKNELYKKPIQPGFGSMLMGNNENPELTLRDTYIEKQSQINVNKYARILQKSSDTAIIFLNGVIGGSLFDSGIDTAAFDQQVNIILKNKSIKNVIISIDSPGGAVGIAMQMFNRLEQLKEEKKKIIVSQGTLAASGGYWFSVIGDKIWSHSLTITGSIGVFNLIPVFRHFLKNIGITYDEINTFEDSNIFNNIMKDDEKTVNIAKEKWQKNVNKIYEDFKDHIAKHRHKIHSDFKIKDDITGGGRIFSGEDGKKLKLVDEIGGIFDIMSDLENNSNKIPGIPYMFSIKQGGFTNLNSMKLIIKNYNNLVSILEKIDKFKNER
jgi:protease IV